MESLVVFAISIGSLIGILLCYMLLQYCLKWCKKRKSRLSRDHLDLLKTIEFRKNESSYESCAICIEDFVDGDELRVLPCSHGYHWKCIDDWLMDNRGICPICKVVPLAGMGPDCDSESDTDFEREATERTPLLTGGVGSGRSNRGTFSPVIPTTISTEAASGNPTSSGNVTIATFCGVDEVPFTRRSCPTTTHVSTTHSIGCDSEKEMMERYASPGGSSTREVEGAIAFTLK